MANFSPAPSDVALLSGYTQSPIPRLAIELKDLAPAIGCDLSTLYRQAFAGNLIVRKLGRKSIVLLSEANDFLLSLPKGPTPELTAAAAAASRSKEDAS